MTLRISNDRFDKVSVTPPTLKLPQLFSSTPTSSGKAGNVQRRHDTAPQASQTENLSDRIDLDSPSINQVESLAEGLLCLLTFLLKWLIILKLKAFLMEFHQSFVNKSY